MNKFRVKANIEIRKAIKDADLYHWQVANALGISEMTFCRWLRKELSEQKKQVIMQAIESLKNGTANPYKDEDENVRV